MPCVCVRVCVFLVIERPTGDDKQAKDGPLQAISSVVMPARPHRLQDVRDPTQYAVFCVSDDADNVTS